MIEISKPSLYSKYGYLIVFLLTLWVGLVQAALTARLDRDQITEGETVRLLVEAEGQVSGSPDTTPLQADFEVLGINSGSRVNIINGRMDASTSWTITLSPKRSGKLTVPALELEGEQTQPLTLQVSETPVASGPASGSSIFIETEVDRSDPYVQGMLRYTVRLFYEVKLAEGSLSEPQLDNALMRRLGKDREYSAERKGHRYRVIERRYAIFPQTSGELELPAPVLDARVPDQTAKRRSPFQGLFGRDPFDDHFFGGSRLGDVFTSTRPVRVRGESRLLQVRPRPHQTAGHEWLPAETVVLSESWQPQAGELRVGDPITRSITLRAQGVTGEQLPELDPGPVAGFKVYPDRAQVNTQDLQQTVQGEMSRNVAFVPIRPGRFTLPAVSLHWWDTQTDQERRVELPERNVEVLPALTSQGGRVPQSSQTETIEESQIPAPSGAEQTLPQSAVLDNGAGERTLQGSTAIWPWISLLFGILWLVTLGIWWQSRRHSEVAPVALSGVQNPAPENAVKARARFQAACRANDPKQARKSLLEWAAAHWLDDPPRGLDELAQRLDDSQVKQTLNELDRLLYRGSAQTWDGKRLAQVLTKLPSSSYALNQDGALPDLYT